MADTLAPLDPDLVQEFVGKAHGDFGRVQELLDQHPPLLNAAWDWGEVAGRRRLVLRLTWDGETLPNT